MNSVIDNIIQDLIEQPMFRNELEQKYICSVKSKHLDLVLRHLILVYHIRRYRFNTKKRTMVIYYFEHDNIRAVQRILDLHMPENRDISWSMVESIIGCRILSKYKNKNTFLNILNTPEDHKKLFKLLQTNKKVTGE